MKMKDLINKIKQIEILKRRISEQEHYEKMFPSNLRLRDHIKEMETELTALEEEEIFNAKN